MAEGGASKAIPKPIVSETKPEVTAQPKLKELKIPDMGVRSAAEIYESLKHKMDVGIKGNEAPEAARKLLKKITSAQNLVSEEAVRKLQK